MVEKECDLAVVGGGPGGYVAAIRAARKGLSVCLVERAELGGVCLNWGCIPSKSLIHQAAGFADIAAFERCGLKVDRSGFRYADVHARSRQAARTLSGGIAGLMKKNGIAVIRASARLAGPGRLVLSTGGEVVARNIILATGSSPAVLPGFDFDETRFLSSTGILALSELPRSLAIIGAGAIGCEFAYVMNAFGVKVTLLELQEQLLPLEDRDSAKVVHAAFVEAGVAVITGARVVGWAATDSGLDLTIARAGKESSLSCEKVLIATGRVPNTGDLGLDTAGVRRDGRGFVTVGPDYRTSAPNVYAIGDIVDTPALAHVASREAEIAVDAIVGLAGEGLDRSLVPSAIYCEPQVAGFGLREAEAKSGGVRFKTAAFPFLANGKAVAVGATRGHVKLLSDPDTGELLGAHIVGHNATELIHELLLTRASETLAGDLAHMMHAHPTLSEAIMEAAASVDGRPVHL